MNMIYDHSSVMPVLKMEQGRAGEYYTFPLFVPDRDIDSRKIPLVHFEQHNQLISSPYALGISGREMVQAAFSNLRQQPANWQIYKDEDNQVSYIACSDQKDAAGKLLDPANMQQAAAILQCKELLAVIPHADTIIVTCAAQAERNTLFIDRARREFEKISVPTLTDLAFVYADNQIISTREIFKPFSSQEPEKPHMLELTGRQQAQITEIPVFTGDFFYKVEVSGENDTQLIDACEKTIFFLLQKGIHQPRFLGIIEFIINRSANPFTEELDQKLTRFWELLQQSQQVRALSTRMKKNIEVSIVFGEHYARGESYRKKHFRIEYSK